MFRKRPTPQGLLSTDRGASPCYIRLGIKTNPVGVTLVGLVSLPYEVRL